MNYISIYQHLQYAYLRIFFDWQFYIGQFALIGYFSIMPEAIGVKTGHTNNAQYTLVGAAQKDGRELIGVILGAPDENIFQNHCRLIAIRYNPHRQQLVLACSRQTARLFLMRLFE